MRKKQKKEVKKRNNNLELFSILILLALILILIQTCINKDQPINFIYNATCPNFTYEDTYFHYVNKAINENDFRICEGLEYLDGPNNTDPKIECYYEFAAEKLRAEICALPESKNYVITDGVLIKNNDESYTKSDAYGPDKCYLLVVDKNAPKPDFTKNQTIAICNQIQSESDKETCLKYIDIYEKR